MPLLNTMLISKITSMSFIAELLKVLSKTISKNKEIQTPSFVCGSEPGILFHFLLGVYLLFKKVKKVFFICCILKEVVNSNRILSTRLNGEDF